MAFYHQAKFKITNIPNKNMRLQNAEMIVKNNQINNRS